MANNKTSLPHHTSQTSGGKYQTFNNLNNIRTTDSSYAETATIQGKSKPLNRPATVTANKFQAGLPTGAMITKITVKYKHSKVATSGNKTPNITAPKITLMNGSKPFKWSNGKAMTKTGQAPTTTATERTEVFNGVWAYNDINSNNFAVKIDYPTNANENSGKVRLYYVKVKLTYVLPSYGLSIQQNKSENNGEYNGDDYWIYVNLSNLKRTTYDPTLTIEAPIGFTLEEWSASDGTFNRTSARVATFKPAFTRSTVHGQVMLRYSSNLTFPSGTTELTREFSVSESLHGTTKTCEVTVKKDKPADPTVDPDQSTQEHFNQDTKDNTSVTFQSATVNEEFTYTFSFDDNTWNGMIQTIYNYGIEQEWFTGTLEEELETIRNHTLLEFIGEPPYLSKNGYLRWKDGSTWDDHYRSKGLKLVENDGKQTTITLKGTSVGYDEMYVRVRYHDYDNLINYTFDIFDSIIWKFDIRPAESSLSTPSCSVLTLGKEELDRLGDGYNYTVQSFLKENTSEDYVRDWGKNLRIGVFNNAIESNVGTITYVDEETGETQDIAYDTTDYNNLSVSDIISNAEYWSPCPKDVNSFTNLECRFPYNDDYPLYILIVGDYTEASTMATITYTEPVIVESDYYTSRVANGNYPVPIDDLVLNDGSTSEISIGALNKSDTIVFYDLPLEDDFGTNDEIAIRGIQINGTVESSTDNLILNATLVNSKQESKNRSIVLDQLDNTTTNEFSIGQVGDLWGFHTQDIKEFEDWEIHLTLNNSVNDYDAQCNFGNINLSVYIETIEHQNIRCYIDGEDLSYYGVFLQDVKVPEGLKTDTDYINVNGTDVNDPYRQNIREKTMELEFDIGDNCDLEEATLSLRQLTRLLVNERDPYNRPIPKRIEFSHYPDVYWEYIMEEPLDNEVEISSYTVKAKLVIPAGTSYDKVSTKTNTTGYISGLASLRPNIILKPNNSIITVKETHTNQEFHITYKDTSWNGKYVEIDCDNRIVWLKEDDDDEDGVNISNFVDWNSDWFTLYGEYEFETNNCAILSVQWEERW